MDSYKPLICIVEDDLDHGRTLGKILTNQNFRVDLFASATEFLDKKIPPETYDLVITDINMPGVTGFELCRAIRAAPEAVRLPVILMTGSDPAADHAIGLEVGADEFIGKPFSSRHLLAKIRSLLDIRAQELRKYKELESSKGLNIELGRFVSPNIVSRFSAVGQQGFLKPHRAEVTVLFVDLRRFTAFSEKAEPEEVLEVLGQYYTAVGRAALKYKGTLGHLAGDGIMVFFNDPEPIEDHRGVAIRVALEAREALIEQKRFWDERHYNIDFGMGLSEGFATIGGIGFDQFSQYSVIGTVANFASRLCHEAVDGQILISQRFLSRLDAQSFNASFVGEMNLKGIEKSVLVHNIISATEALKSTG